MSDVKPIVIKLQADAADSNVSVSSLLRMAKMIATKLDQKEALEWIDKELEGYSDMRSSSLPEYRQLSGSPKAFNPYRGWIPMNFGNSKNGKMLSSASVGQALGSLEEVMKNTRDKGLYYDYPHELKNELMKSMEIPMDIRIEISAGQVFGIIDAVRNLVLNWSLELEQAGILGEGMIFSRSDKDKAVPVTHQIFAQNIGNIGNVSDAAKVQNSQQGTQHQNINIQSIRDLKDQIDGAINLLPKEIAENVNDLNKELHAALDTEVPKPERIHGILTSIKTVCEGAAGNLTAQGIIGLITALI